MHPDGMGLGKRVHMAQTMMEISSSRSCLRAILHNRFELRLR
jgi:hypothetical protein